MADDLHPDICYYQVLNVAPTVSHAQIRKAYKRLQRNYNNPKNHPNNGSVNINTINKAYFMLSNGTRRRDYDRAQNSTQLVVPLRRPQQEPQSFQPSERPCAVVPPTSSVSVNHSNDVPGPDTQSIPSNITNAPFYNTYFAGRPVNNAGIVQNARILNGLPFHGMPNRWIYGVNYYMGLPGVDLPTLTSSTGGAFLSSEDMHSFHIQNGTCHEFTLNGPIGQLEAYGDCMRIIATGPRAKLTLHGDDITCEASGPGSDITIYGDGARCFASGPGVHVTVKGDEGQCSATGAGVHFYALGLDSHFNSSGVGNHYYAPVQGSTYVSTGIGFSCNFG